MARDKKPYDPPTDREIAERMERAVQRSFQMSRVPHKPAKPKPRPASKGRSKRQNEDLS